MRKPVVGMLTMALLGLLAEPAVACPVCFGASDAPPVQGMRMAIIALLIVTVGVLGAFGTFFVYLVRRARAGHPDAVAASGTPAFGERAVAGRAQRSV